MSLLIASRKPWQAQLLRRSAADQAKGWSSGAAVLHLLRAEQLSR
ncbi:MAG: hypothetical protein NW223_06305 [Hyphomicrobiaceae bacterium]|nr:hypothetical protein [Hyphomicrobiaceae bacterium]